MKTIGQQAEEFRLYKGWNSSRMGKEVGTSRQNIENLEAVGNRKPHYIADLARVMGTTVDELIAGEYRVPSSAAATATGPEPVGSSETTPRLGVELHTALERIAWSIAHSQHRGSDALAGVFASLCKEPENALYLEMLERLLTEKQGAPRKAASRAA